MKILVSIYSLHRGGAERVVSLLSREWAKEHEVVIALSDTSDVAYSYGGRIVDMHSKTQEGSMRKLLVFLKRVGTMVRIIHMERPERIVTFMESTNFPAIVAAILTGRVNMLIVSIHNNPAVLKKKYGFFFSLLYMFARHIVVVSQGIKDALQGDGIIWAERSAVIPNPVDAEYIEEISQETCPVHEIASHTILSVGRLHEQKNFSNLIETYVEMRKKVSSLRETNLVILGEGYLRKELEKQIIDYHAEKYIFLPGFCTDVYACMKKSGVFVLNSLHEGMPMVLVEAMACGLPVVSVDCPYGPRDIIHGSGSGILVPFGDSKALLERVAALFSDLALYHTMVERGMNTARRHDVKVLAPLWLSL
jgi:GalNAc-alpha-(1->4)-GalNAc-alpha-(1->3)-diNAcBac-PP-undecaprenol alpha-1,4-N-acetyl-D-galactosaminyltransferase